MEHIMESIGFMLSKDFKKRTKAEYWQLALRCEKLEEMCRKYEAGELSFTPNCSLTLLRAQLEAMKAYKGCLEERAEVDGLIYQMKRILPLGALHSERIQRITCR